MVTPLTLTLDQLPDSTVVHAAGDIDASNCAELAEAIFEGRQRGNPLILDFSAVTFLDSSGLHVLLNAHDGAAHGKHNFSLAAPHPRVTRLLQITGVLHHLQVHASVEQARTAAATRGQHMVGS
ncbi:STAS domain-containing protein [Herbidospora mongoliensis]|uniref:STAS domain-containing protein n=1 Tax=Herbidospora mongoliensis TaxID=688067 RepID=UPI00082FD33E|nr:STAS domain-containing protein [Herbidospora mongoliensis]